MLLWGNKTKTRATLFTKSKYHKITNEQAKDNWQKQKHQCKVHLVFIYQIFSFQQKLNLNFQGMLSSFGIEQRIIVGKNLSQ